ncbi:MAG: cell wall binding repeat 2-containing protein, partial [Herbinix sp.]|nr:cell wall binding repeat 2-containing protein [Herbinix sp.]
TASVKINLRVSDKATWKLYSDKACTKEIANHKPDLKEGINTVYAKITAENGKTSKIYTLKITRKKAEYKEQIKLGLIGSKTYAEKVAKVFAEEYDCKNVVVKQEGKYYRITMNFPDKSAAIKACEDMKRVYCSLLFYGTK